MKKYKDTRIAIIGFGFLMGYLFDCLKEFLGEEKLATNIIATTADENTIVDKRNKYPFQIFLNKNLDVLRMLKPDIILFAPPPSVAPEIIEGELKTYFNECVKKPDIYAFPPSPAGRYYMDVLGEDIFVCNILPNMVKEIGGKFLNGSEGYSTLTYPDGIISPTFNKNRLKAFLSPVGGTIEVSSDKIMNVLAAYVMIDLWPHRLIKAVERIGAKSLKSILDENRQIKLYIKEISDAIIHFLINSGISEITAMEIVEQRNKLVFHMISETKVEDLKNDMAAHATKGGVFEKGAMLHEIAIDNCSAEFFRNNECDLKKVLCSCLQIVANHGNELAKTGEITKLHPGIHGMIFALYVRKLKNVLPQGAETVIEAMAKEYGNQRGSRMRKRADMAGFSGRMEDYMAFGEWSADEGDMGLNTSIEDGLVITRVDKCPWYSEWKKFGFISEGEYYCKFVDKALVRGFNETLNLDVNSIRPDGSEFCEFVWNGLKEENMYQFDKNKRVMPWKFHIAHLLKCIEDNSGITGDIYDSLKTDIAVIYNVDLDKITEEYRDTDFESI